MIVQNKSGTEVLALLSHLLSTQSDLRQCGASVLHQLSLISSLLLDPSSPSNRARAHDLSLSLLKLADEKILSYHYSAVPIWWRRLYTDASLLAVIAQLLGGEEQEEGERREQVRLLDMTLIVSGAPGDGREDALFSLLSLCQTRLPSPSSSHSAEPLPKRPRLSPPSPSRHPAPHIINPIPRFSPADAPTLDAYLTQPTLLSRPFIISGGCLDWPATAPGLWDSREYLAQKAGGGRVVPVEVGTSYTEEGWGQRVVPFSSFLESIFTGEGEVGNKEKLYLAQHTLFHQFPSLLPDVLLPDYVYSSPPASADAPNYQPPNNEDGYTMNAWLGPKGTVSPPHTDRWFNCFAQVVGSKWLWVAPPSCGPWMSAYGPDPSPLAGEGEGPAEGVGKGKEEEDGEGGATNHLLTNTSRLPVHLHRHTPSLKPSSSSSSSSALEPFSFSLEPPSTQPSSSSLADPVEPATFSSTSLAEPSIASPSPLDKFPSFAEHVEPYAMQAILDRGDLLVMPPGWWHSMMSLERSFSVSIWY